MLCGSDACSVMSGITCLVNMPGRVFRGRRRPPGLRVCRLLRGSGSTHVVEGLYIIQTTVRHHFKGVGSGVEGRCGDVCDLPRLVPRRTLQRLSLSKTDFCGGSDAGLTRRVVRVGGLVESEVGGYGRVFPI